MVNREGEPGQQWENDTRPPFRALVMSADDAINKCVSNFVFDLGIFHYRPVPS